MRMSTASQLQAVSKESDILRDPQSETVGTDAFEYSRHLTPGFMAANWARPSADCTLPTDSMVSGRRKEGSLPWPVAEGSKRSFSKGDSCSTGGCLDPRRLATHTGDISPSCQRPGSLIRYADPFPSSFDRSFLPPRATGSPSSSSAPSPRTVPTLGRAGPSPCGPPPPARPPSGCRRTFGLRGRRSSPRGRRSGSSRPRR